MRGKWESGRTNKDFKKQNKPPNLASMIIELDRRQANSSD